MSTFGLLGGQKGQINERIMKVGNYVDYEWGFFSGETWSKKKAFGDNIVKGSSSKESWSHNVLELIFLVISIFFYIFAIFIFSIRMNVS